MKIIFGLGNPGQQYKDNRHNVGYKVLDSLVSSQNLEFKRSFRTSSYIAKKTDTENWVLFIKPRTFMNNSGLCVKKVVSKYKVKLSDIVIIYDDSDLPLGKIRFRTGGSCAGHRGMKSIISVLGSEGVNRLRIGIGSSQNQELSDYVLSDFSRIEREILDGTIMEAASASLDWVNQGIDFSMQKYNRRGGQ
ncbi:MAG: aminoacyl-tRNA hydrolase [Candidatus Susulua stagnicola]|nr:aminoacyl-tRNA hydrolase [Candidatus Susulua stagnicola]